MPVVAVALRASAIPFTLFMPVRRMGAPALTGLAGLAGGRRAAVKSR
jgi:hypothetical protein